MGSSKGSNSSRCILCFLYVLSTLHLGQVLVQGALVPTLNCTFNNVPEFDGTACPLIMIGSGNSSHPPLSAIIPDKVWGSALDCGVGNNSSQNLLPVLTGVDYGSGGPFAISLWFQLSPNFNVSDSDSSAMFLFSHVPSQLALDLGAMSKVLTNRTLREAPAAPATTANNASTVAAHLNNVTTSSLTVKKHTRRDVSGIHTGDDHQEGLASSQVQVFLPGTHESGFGVVRTLVRDANDTTPLPSFLDSDGMFNNLDGVSANPFKKQVAPGDWHMLTLTTIPGSAKGYQLYLDGRRTAELTRADLPALLDPEQVTGGAPMRFGGSLINLCIGADMLPRSRFNGLISHLKIYNQSLTADDVSQLHIDDIVSAHRAPHYPNIANADARLTSPSSTTTAPSSLSLQQLQQLQIADGSALGGVPANTTNTTPAADVHAVVAPPAADVSLRLVNHTLMPGVITGDGQWALWSPSATPASNASNQPQSQLLACDGSADSSLSLPGAEPIILAEGGLSLSFWLKFPDAASGPATLPVLTLIPAESAVQGSSSAAPTTTTRSLRYFPDGVTARMQLTPSSTMYFTYSKTSKGQYLDVYISEQQSKDGPASVPTWLYASVPLALLQSNALHHFAFVASANVSTMTNATTPTAGSAASSTDSRHAYTLYLNGQPSSLPARMNESQVATLQANLLAPQQLQKPNVVTQIHLCGYTTSSAASKVAQPAASEVAAASTIAPAMGSLRLHLRALKSEAPAAASDTKGTNTTTPAVNVPPTDAATNSTVVAANSTDAATSGDNKPPAGTREMSAQLPEDAVATPSPEASNSSKQPGPAQQTIHPVKVQLPEDNHTKGGSDAAPSVWTQGQALPVPASSDKSPTQQQGSASFGAAEFEEPAQPSTSARPGSTLNALPPTTTGEGAVFVTDLRIFGRALSVDEIMALQIIGAGNPSRPVATRIITKTPTNAKWADSAVISEDSIAETSQEFAAAVNGSMPTRGSVPGGHTVNAQLPQDTTTAATNQSSPAPTSTGGRQRQGHAATVVLPEDLAAGGLPVNTTFGTANGHRMGVVLPEDLVGSSSAKAPVNGSTPVAETSGAAPPKKSVDVVLPEDGASKAVDNSSVSAANVSKPTAGAAPGFGHIISVVLPEDQGVNPVPFDTQDDGHRSGSSRSTRLGLALGLSLGGCALLVAAVGFMMRKRIAHMFVGSSHSSRRRGNNTSAPSLPGLGPSHTGGRANSLLSVTIATSPRASNSGIAGKRAMATNPEPDSVNSQHGAAPTRLPLSDALDLQELPVSTSHTASFTHVGHRRSAAGNTGRTSQSGSDAVWQRPVAGSFTAGMKGVGCLSMLQGVAQMRALRAESDNVEQARLVTPGTPATTTVPASMASAKIPPAAGGSKSAILQRGPGLAQRHSISGTPSRFGNDSQREAAEGLRRGAALGASEDGTESLVGRGGGKVKHRGSHPGTSM